MIAEEYKYEEYSASAVVDVDEIYFIDNEPLVEHRIQRSEQG